MFKLKKRNKIAMNDPLSLEYMTEQKRWRVERKDLMRFHDHLLLYFNENPLLDKEILSQMEYGEFERGGFRLIRFFFNIDHLNQKKAFLTEAFPRDSSLAQKHAVTLFLYPANGSLYSDLSVLPVQMEMKDRF